MRRSHLYDPTYMIGENVLYASTITDYFMMTSSNGKNYGVTGPVWGESTGDRWIPLTKASEAELRCFLWSAPEQMFKQTIKMSVIWDAIALIVTSL